MQLNDLTHPIHKHSILSIAIYIILIGSSSVYADSPQNSTSSKSSNRTAKAKQTEASTDNSVFELGEMTITSSLERSRVLDSRDILTSVDVMYSEKIENQNVQNSYELFHRMPGVQITQFNQGTTSGKLSFRGFNGEGNINAVKLLIDGIPSNTNDGNMPFIDSIFPLDIESLETVRGTNDPRYGLHNIAGNAHINTQQGGSYAKGRVSYGSYDSFDVQAGAGYEKSGLAQNYFIGYRNSQGYRDHSDSDKYSASGKWFYTLPNDKVKVGLIARWSDAQAVEPGYLTLENSRRVPTMTNPYNETDKNHRQMGQVSLHLDVKLHNDLMWSTKSYGNVYDDDRYVKFGPAPTDYQQRRVVEEVQYGAMSSLTYRPKISWLNDFSVETGFDIHEQENKSSRFTFNSPGVLRAKTRDQNFDFSIYGGYLQAMIKPFKWLRITPGFRADHVGGSFRNLLNNTSAGINNYGTIWQPKIGAVITPIQGLSFYGNWGRTFQVALGSATYKISPTATDLEPSKNSGWEVGIKTQPASWLEGRVAYWQQNATSEWVRLLNSPNNDSTNIGATDRQGVDVQLKVDPVKNVSLWGAISVQEAIISTPTPGAESTIGNNIDHTPGFIFSGGIDYQILPQLKASLWTNGQGNYHLDAANSTNKFGDYALLNLNMDYQVNKMVGLQFQMKNITGTYWEYAWYDATNKYTLHSPGDGRTFYGAININYDL